MNSMNLVILIGRLGRDPESRATQSGQQVVNFSVATDRRWKDRDGNRQEETEWHYVVCWGRQAEIASQYLTKGKLVSVEGRLQTRSWEDRETGQKRYRTEIICRNFQMLGSRDEAGGRSEYGSRQADYEPSQASPSNQSDRQDSGLGPVDNDDDIPF